MEKTNWDYYNSPACRTPVRTSNRGSRGMKVLVEFDSLPEKYKSIWVARFGHPNEQEKSSFASSIVFDENAALYFDEYITAAGTTLPDEAKREYANHASLMNALRVQFDKMRIARSRQGKRVSFTAFIEEAASMLQNEEILRRFAHRLPATGRGLRIQYERYADLGYEGLVSKAFGNNNTVKITDEAGEWLWSRFASPVNRVTAAQLFDEYNALASEMGWKTLKSEASVTNYLNRSDIKEKWYATRYGELKYKEKFVRQHRTELPSLRDMLWYSDGTKLNFYYKDENGKTATCQVYEVIDAYSEVLLGYHISKSENYEAQYHAFKMALKTAGHVPYELKFDNQGGHKKLDAGDFLGKVAHLAIPTSPYNGKSKTIENAFKRFQESYLVNAWYFTGQNIQAKKAESKANHEFILANDKNLPSLAEASATYVAMREKWNNAKHPATGISRIEMYRASSNPRARALSILDMIDIFWITTEKPNTYRASGIEIIVSKQKYAYEVLDADGMPDTDFLRKNVDKKFFVKYDPTDMSIVRLYDLDSSGRMRFCAMAQTYIKVHRAKQELTSSEESFIRKVDAVNKTQRIENIERAENALERIGLHPAQHGLKMPSVKGVSKKDRKRADEKKGGSAETIGKMLKAESFADMDFENGLDIFDLM
jgi:hypothetical protein